MKYNFIKTNHLSVKKIVAVVSIMVILTLFSGCAIKQQDNTVNSTSPLQQNTGDSKPFKTNLSFAAGDKTSDSYNYCNTITSVINKSSTDFKLEIINSDGMAQSMDMVSSGKSDVVLASNDMIYSAYNGIGDFSGKKIQNISLVSAVYYEVIEVVVDTEKNIKTLDNLKDMRVSIGKEGSRTYAHSKRILEECGIDLKYLDIKNLDLNESVEAMTNNQIDAFFYMGDIKSDAIAELSKTRKVSVLNIEDDILSKVMLSYPFYSYYTVSGNLYETQRSEVNTFAIKVCLVANNNLSDENVYKLLKSLYENRHSISKENIKGYQLNKYISENGISISHHAGAQKYYKEMSAIE